MCVQIEFVELPLAVARTMSQRDDDDGMGMSLWVYGAKPHSQHMGLASLRGNGDRSCWARHESDAVD